jgi:hypothetical protein
MWELIQLYTEDRCLEMEKGMGTRKEIKKHMRKL